MSLGRSAVDKILLAHLCERAAQDAGQCTDSNTILAEALGMHPKTVSEQIGRLGEAKLILVTVDRELANKRSLRPLAELVADYPSKPDSTLTIAKDYPPNPGSTSSDYPSKPDSPRSGSKPKAHNPVRRCPITDMDISHQGENYPVVTAATIKQLYKSDRQQFEKVATRLEISTKDDSSMADRCRSMLYRVQSIVDTYPADHFKKLAQSQFVEAQRPKRLCPVTGVDITHQRANSRFITIKTLKKLFWGNRPVYEQLITKFLNPSQMNESNKRKGILLIERIQSLSKFQR